MGQGRRGAGVICVAIYQPDYELLRRQIESIMAQTVAYWICHVGIDGADPRTADFVHRLVADDPRFVLHHYEDNVGHYRNFERLIAAADAGYAWIAMSDQDDYWYPDKLEKLLAVLDAHADVAAVSGQARVIGADGEDRGITSRIQTRMSSLLLDNQVGGNLTVFRSSVAQLALPFPEPTDVAYHDHWLGICAKALGTLHFSDDVVLDYLQHDRNVVGEEGGRAALRTRLRNVRSRARGTRPLAYIAKHRWGWRVNMAQTLAERLPATGIEFAVAGGWSNALLRRTFTGVRTREVPFLRAAALLAGAAAWKRTQTQSPSQTSNTSHPQSKRTAHGA